MAGALQLWNLDDPTEPRMPALRDLTETGVRELLEDPMGSPLANDPHAGKSSLGGVQPKVVLVRRPDGWAQALGGYPTTLAAVAREETPLDGAFALLQEQVLGLIQNLRNGKPAGGQRPIR